MDLEAYLDEARLLAGVANYVYALNPVGTLKWRYLTGASVNASPAIGAWTITGSTGTAC